MTGEPKNWSGHEREPDEYEPGGGDERNLVCKGILPKRIGGRQMDKATVVGGRQMDIATVVGTAKECAPDDHGG